MKNILLRIHAYIIRLVERNIFLPFSTSLSLDNIGLCTLSQAEKEVCSSILMGLIKRESETPFTKGV